MHCVWRRDGRICTLWHHRHHPETWEFNSVDLIYSLTGGGPVGKTTTLSMLIANQAIKTSNYGYGSALSVVSFAILAVIAVIYMKLSGFGKEEA